MGNLLHDVAFWLIQWPRSGSTSCSTRPVLVLTSGSLVGPCSGAQQPAKFLPLCVGGVEVLSLRL